MLHKYAPKYAHLSGLMGVCLTPDGLISVMVNGPPFLETGTFTMFTVIFLGKLNNLFNIFNMFN